MDQEKIKNIDSIIFETSKKFQVLKHLSWPVEEEQKFLSERRKGNWRLPQFKPQVPKLSEHINTLETIISQCDQDDPIEKFLSETALSYATAGKMLESIGTQNFTRYSEMIYGRPDDKYKKQKITAIDAADFFLKITDEILGHYLVPPTNFNIDSEKFAESIRPMIDEFFWNDIVDVVLDSEISAKALAGSKKIKISEGTLFSELDKDQLLNHEAFIHTATMLNGKNQNNLKCLSLGAPRTTRTQEGLAVLSELATLSIDIKRLRRIALRVIAVQMALDGADFIDLFKYFNESGQSEEDSVRSTQRIFRGGAVEGGVVFTKDGVYLPGLLEVHSFVRLSIWKNNPEYIFYLFSGRLTMSDVMRLAPLFEIGWLKLPFYIPSWASDIRKFSALIAYSVFVSKIELHELTFEGFVEFEEGLKNRKINYFSSRSQAA